MINKSKIRQIALSLIYAIEENGGNADGLDKNLFWRIALEKDTDRYRLALSKAIAHVCRASTDSAQLLEARANAALDATAGDLTASKLRADIDRLQKRSSEFESALAAMRYCAKDKRQDTTDQLELCCKDILLLARSVEGLCSDLLPGFSDFPIYRPQLDPLGAALRRRSKLMAACSALASPLDLESKNEFAGLVKSACALKEIPLAAEELAWGVLSKKAEYDARLEELLHNYSISRLDVVDRCLIYISFYELEENKLDIPIVVSEAIALANTYSSGKSAPFIHGLISAVANKPEDPPNS